MYSMKELIQAASHGQMNESDQKQAGADSEEGRKDCYFCAVSKSS